jgi:CRISPR/Cas system-associated protein Cas5 (RAMP superfamily)
MKIEQGDLFGSTPSAARPMAAAPKTTSYKNPPNTTLLGGLDEATLKAESVYLLRVLANQYTRAFPNAEAKKKFMHTIKAEMKLKQGILDPILLLRDSLLKRNI